VAAAIIGGIAVLLMAAYVVHLCAAADKKLKAEYALNGK